jgi:hypothetical protein
MDIFFKILQDKTTSGTVQIFNIKIVKKYKLIEGNHNVGKVKTDQA